MKDLVTPRQVARAIGVSESSLKRWCDRGLIPTVRTAGGHRRLPVSGVLEFLRQSHQQLVQPELLGLPATSGKSDRITNRSREQLRQALLAADEEACRQIIFDLWFSGQLLTEIGDQVIAPAFREIGDCWATREVDVYQERQACELMLRVLLQVRSRLPPGKPELQAIGGTPAGDVYCLPTTLAELVLQERGWTSRSLGSSIPFASLARAVREQRPRLFWLSVSYVADTALFIQEFELLAAATIETGTALAVGGFAMTPELRGRLKCSAFCETMLQLADFGQTCKTLAPPA